MTKCPSSTCGQDHVTHFYILWPGHPLRSRSHFQRPGMTLKAWRSFAGCNAFQMQLDEHLPTVHMVSTDIAGHVRSLGDSWEFSTILHTLNICGTVAEWLTCWTQSHGPAVQMVVATLSGNSLRQTVHIHRASVHQAAKMVAALLRIARVTAGLAERLLSVRPAVTLTPGLWLTSPAGWLPRTVISSGNLRSVIEYGLPLPFLLLTLDASTLYTSWVLWSISLVMTTLPKWAWLGSCDTFLEFLGPGTEWTYLDFQIWYAVWTQRDLAYAC